MIKLDFNPRSLGMLLSFVLVSIPTLSQADVVVPVDRLTAELRQQTQIPILIPHTLPAVDDLYSNIEGNDSSSYELSFTYTPDCHGTACTWGYFSAIQGGSPSLEGIGPHDTVEAITLANGVQGWFTNFCGAYCTASASWVTHDVLYVASIKNGRKQDVIAFANSALVAGSSTGQK